MRFLYEKFAAHAGCRARNLCRGASKTVVDRRACSIRTLKALWLSKDCLKIYFAGHSIVSFLFE